MRFFDAVTRVWIALGLILVFALSLDVYAQQDPHIGYVYPAGGQPGSVFEVTVGGQHLDDVSEVGFTGNGTEASIIRHVKPLNKKQMKEKRAELRDLQKKVREERQMRKKQQRMEMAASPPDSTDWLTRAQKNIAAMRKQLFNPKKQPNQQIAETVILKLALASNATPGERELRLKTPRGWSNPIRFRIDALPEYRERASDSRDADMVVENALPVVLNGQIMPGDVDRFRFRAHKGDRLVAAVLARALTPYLADAVPGWFQAVLTLYDADGHELAYVDDDRFQPDPVLFYEVPRDGEYVLEIRDAIYRGREDFVYRIALGELPYVTDIFPLGGQMGRTCKLELSGWNLSEDRLKVNTRRKNPGIYPIVAHTYEGVFNPLPFAMGTLPERLEKEPNGVSRAQKVSLPLIVNGRIDAPGDRDVFRFSGKKGQAVVAEIYARRLHSPLDARLTLMDVNGKTLDANDDFEDKGAGWVTHHADPYLMEKLPADGVYRVKVEDVQHKGGKAYAYRLRISPPEEDFELRMAPSNLNIHAGATAPFTVYALRKDGFGGDIELKMIDVPEGFVLSGSGIPAGRDRARLTLTAPRDFQGQTALLKLRGQSAIDGQTVRRMAVPADDLTQAFVNHHLVPTTSMLVSVIRRRGPVAAVRVLNKKPIKLRPGKKASVRVLIPGRAPLAQVKLALNDPPEGISLLDMRAEQRRVQIVFQADAEKVTAGLKGNLIVDAFLEREGKTKDGTPSGKRRRIPMGTLPAIPFEIAGK